MKVIIAGGGTGGHLFPAVAVAEELLRQRPQTEVLFVGSTAGMEAAWLPTSGYKYQLLDVHGLLGHGLSHRLQGAARFLGAIRRARALLRSFRPAVVVSVGGYASAPIAVAAISGGVPLVMLEQNAIPGLVNRLFGRFARSVCLGFSDAARFFSRAKVRVTGNPIRREAQTEGQRPVDNTFQILVLGGSSGAHRLNLGVLNAFNIFGKDVINLSIVHQTGGPDVEAVRAGYSELEMRAKVVQFIDEVGPALRAADLIVARAGGMTVAEVALAGKPAVFVPYPFHRDHQQELNARVIEREGGALIVRDDGDLGANLARLMRELVADRARLAEMGARAAKAARPHAAEEIAQVCFELSEARVTA